MLTSLEDFTLRNLVAPGAGLDADFAEAVQQLIQRCAEANFEFRLVNGLRSPQLQAEYYCRWNGHPPSHIDIEVKRLKEKGAPWLAGLLLRYRDIKRQNEKLTGQLPGSGWHQWGLAADCYCFRNGEIVKDGEDPCYQFFAETAKEIFGLRAGYYFKARDSGHVQAPSSDGAENVFSWIYIDHVMKRRFGEAVAVAVPEAFVDMALESVAPSIPPDAKPSDIKVKSGSVFGPGGIRFGKTQGPGMFNFGQSSIGDVFKQDPNAFPDTPQSLQRVMQSVSENEGKIEAINTYDNSFLSVGIFQWTAGAEGDPGELAGLLHTLKQRAPQTAKAYFGDHGLEAELTTSGPNKLLYGHLLLNGTKLNTAKRKSVLREHIWSYRFWRAAHDPEVRRAQIALAMARIPVFHHLPIKKGSPLTVAQCVTSEYGVALLLDQHVNRPGHVPGTLNKGIEAFIAKTGKADPKKWTDSDERRVLTLYLEFRAKTSMTNSQKRAQVTKAYVDKGALSDLRGSFLV
jgi:hypothetical protein